MEKIYNFSKESIKQRKKHMILLLIIMPISMAVFTYFLITVISFLGDIL